MKRAPAALALITALLLICAGPGAATTWYVDVGGSGYFLTIQEGIDASSDGDTIIVAAGTYTLGEEYSINFNGKRVLLMSESGPDVTIVDATGEFDFSIGFDLINLEDSNTVIDGFTVTNASVAGIRIEAADPVIRNCIITGNDSLGIHSGGGISLASSSSKILNCTISDNHSSGGGGGIVASSCPDLLVQNCDISENSGNGSGGGFYLYSCTARILDCTIRDNHIVGSDNNGGGIYAENCDSVLIENCVISGNSAGKNGGGVFLEGSHTTFLGCSIIGNDAEIYGGGVYAMPFSILLLEGCSIIGNTASSFAGLSALNATTLRHCDILDNEASESTGGIRLGNFTTVEILTTDNCTVAYNTAPMGGAGITASGPNTTTINTIVAFNDGVGFYASANVPQISCSDVYGNTAGNYSGYLPDQTGINDNISEDPFFCEQPSYDTFIYSASPCAAANSPCGTLIGRSGVACTSLPDLLFASVEFDDYYPPVDGNIQATIKIKNIGHITAYGFFAGYYFDMMSPPVPGQSGNIFFYTDSLAAGDSLTHWIPNISNDEVEEWSSYFQVDYTSAVPELDESNNVSGPHLINWTIPPTDGWPVAGGGDFYSSPVIALLDNDPRTKEVVIGCDDGYLYAYSAYGTVLPGQWPVNLGAPVRSSPAVGNITGTYHNEIVVGCGAYLYAFDWAGTQLWTFGPSMAVNSTPALVDLDDDGELEILFSRKNLIGDVQLFALEGDGTVYPGSWPVPLGGSAATSPAVGDMDQDGDIEIAVVSSAIEKLEDMSYVYLFNSDGTHYSLDWPVLIDTIVTCSPVMGNIASTYNLEIITGGLNGTIYAINLFGNTWPILPQLQGSVDMSLALAQLDVDDRQEIIATSRYWVDTPFPGHFSSVVTVLDNDGTIMSGWPQAAGTWITGLILPSPVAFYEKIFAGSPGGNVYGWESSAASITGFPIDVEGRVYSSVAIGDLRGNGYLDLVVATSADSVYAFDLGVVEDFETSSNLCWPFYRNDRTRSGCYFVDPVTDAGYAEDILPVATAFQSIHPNPFNPATTITFDISKRTRVRLTIYDAAGRTVRVLKDEAMNRGRHEAVWNGKNSAGISVATGVYFCRLSAGDIVQTEKMVLLR